MKLHKTWENKTQCHGKCVCVYICTKKVKFEALQNIKFDTKKDCYRGWSEDCDQKVSFYGFVFCVPQLTSLVVLELATSSPFLSFFFFSFFLFGFLFKKKKTLKTMITTIFQQNILFYLVKC